MTAKEQILKYLSNNWIYGGTIEIEVSGIAKTKSSVVRRRLQELAKEGRIEKRLVANPNGKGVKVIQYRKFLSIPLIPKEIPKEVQFSLFNSLNKKYWKI